MNFFHPLLCRCFKLLCFFCLGLGLLIVDASPPSAATIDDLEFVLIHGGSAYAVSAKNPKSISGEVTIPALYNGKPVTWIMTHAFENCSAITSVIFPDTLISIGEWAFYGCSALASIDLSDTEMTFIGARAFAECTALSIALLPNTITSIQDLAFDNCRSLTSIDLSPMPITSIKSGTFNKCSALTSILLPDTVTHVGSEAFRGCSALASIDLSHTAVTSIQSGTFNGCTALTSVRLPNSLNSIGNEAFKGCSALPSITLSDNVTTIGSWAFSGCFALASIDLSKLTIQSIEASVFNLCTALTSLVLPNSVSSIGDNAFSHCKHLASVQFLGSAPTLGTDSFLRTGSNLGGLTITIYKSHETSYAAWSDSYVFNVIEDPTTGPVILVLKTDYDPSNQAFSIISKGEDISIALHLQHLSSLGAAWATVNTSTYEKVIDGNSDTVTRTLTINPTTHPTGFFRLASE